MEQMDNIIQRQDAERGDVDPIVHEEAARILREMAEHPLSLEQKREQVRKGNPRLVRYGNPYAKRVQKAKSD